MRAGSFRRGAGSSSAVLRRVVTRVSTTAVEIALRGIRAESRRPNRLQSIPRATVEVQAAVLMIVGY